MLRPRHIKKDGGKGIIVDVIEDIGFNRAPSRALIEFRIEL